MSLNPQYSTSFFPLPFPMGGLLVNLISTMPFSKDSYGGRLHEAISQHDRSYLNHVCKLKKPFMASKKLVALGMMSSALSLCLTVSNLRSLILLLLSSSPPPHPYTSLFTSTSSQSLDQIQRLISTPLFKLYHLALHSRLPVLLFSFLELRQFLILKVTSYLKENTFMTFFIVPKCLTPKRYVIVRVKANKIFTCKYEFRIIDQAFKSNRL